ncbi:MAG: DUF5076 domain-containing protein [Pseudomonadota bacterium]
MFWKKKHAQETISVENPMLFVLREESATQTLSVHLDPAQLGSAEAAGLMLADVGRHMARALAASDIRLNEAQAFERLVKMFNAEAKSPTQPVQGGLVQ